MLSRDGERLVASEPPPPRQKERRDNLCSILNAPSYLRWQSKTAQINETMNASKDPCTSCFQLCNHVRVGSWECSPFVIRVPKRDGSSLWALRGNPPQGVQRAIKSQRIPWSCLSPDRNFSRVANCETQQKPPLPQEGFGWDSAAGEKRGVKKCLCQMKYIGGKIQCYKDETVRPHMVGSYYARVFISSERSEN